MIDHRPLKHPLDAHPIAQPRAPLVRAKRALREGRVSVGFIGGSITADNGYNWPETVIAWLLANFPAAALSIENAAVGGTGSDSGCLRVDAEIIERGCDLCFVEYAVNDRLFAAERRGRAREGLIRKLRSAGIDVVLIYTYSQPMHADMQAGRVPDSIAEFEALAERYDLSSAWVGLHALREVLAGRMKWHQWLPDSLHPDPRGSLVYGEAVIQLLKQQLVAASPGSPAEPSAFPAPLHALHWENAKTLPLESAQTRGPWFLRRVHDYKHLDRVLETQAPGARLSFTFSGRGLCLIIEYGKISADFRYRLDQGDWISVNRERPAWAGDRGRADPFVVSDELPPGEHVFELEVIHGDRPECSGTEFRLVQIGIL